jgi:hypothetical protein
MAKSFSWSYSKLKNYDTCPKRHYEIDIAKSFQDSGEALVWGNQVHDAFAKRLTTNAVLPDGMQEYEKWVDSIAAGSGELLVEQKFALTRDFQPTEWFGPRAWFRGICDALRLDKELAIAVDWKTGKMKHDPTQLMLMTACIFAHHPDVQLVESRFVWLQEDAMTRERYTRKDIANEWLGVLPRVEDLEDAAINLNYPPKPGKLCFKWCPVVSCPFHGKSHR